MLKELRRSKSFSGRKCEGFIEPRRRSCDVLGRSTLWSLFNLDDQRHGSSVLDDVNAADLRYPRLLGTVYALREEDENEEEIRVSENVSLPNANLVDQRVEELTDGEELMTMKEHIDLEWQSKKQSVRDLKGVAGTVWIAASAFSKQLRKWRQKQKMKKLSGDGRSLTKRAEKGIGRQLRETQSEIAEYGFGRRSCDTEPRFSVDAGRLSLDDPRCSLDEPRASWDGYLAGRTLMRLPSSILRNSENSQILVEGAANRVDDEEVPPLKFSQARRSCDHSSMTGKMAVVAEVDDKKSSLSNARVSPENIEFFHGTKKLHFSGRHLRDPKSGSLKDELCTGSKKGLKKGWNIWELIQRRSDRNFEKEERHCRENAADPINGSGEAKAGFSSKLINGRGGGCGDTRREESVLDKNRSTRYSTKNLDSGLLRFYLTPLRSNNTKSSSNKPRKSMEKKNSQSVAAHVLV